ncbi:glutamine amidotransferase-related protein [Corynebacterium qintianiae]|uniref:glutamine amidotransferase-related protein n=1 Tax=Corynebacterium qintianiae TaxID=2709392 RepID=UPI0013EB94A9|nr:glutamine amidotransferase [Corynebacterium qintianiae]
MARILLVSLRTGDIGPEVARAELDDVLSASRLSEPDIQMRVLDNTSVKIGPLDGYDGVIVGGSSLNVTAPEYSEWQRHIHAELATLLSCGLPVFFVCFGISWLVAELGGTVGHSAPEASGPSVVTLTAAGKKDPLLEGFPSSFNALTGHTENPEFLPDSLEVLATGPTSPVQMVRYGDRVWATQFHAEMDAAAMKTRMDFFYDYGYFPLTEYDTIIASLPSVEVRWANELLRRFVRFCSLNPTVKR